jgi:hypothetical protein
MNTLSDQEAMDKIYTLMDGAVWNPDLLDAIAEVVRSTGREISDLPS